MRKEKVSFPEAIQDPLIKFTTILEEEGFFDNEEDFPPDHIEQGKINLWNITGEELLGKFISGCKDYTFTEDEVTKILTTTIIQTNLDSLMADKLIDGIEDENGEMRYWMTEKGKEIHKNLDKDC